MTETVRVYVNERAVDLPPGAVATAAIAAFDPGLAAAVAEGRAYLTDGRGIRLAADAPLAAGAILRVVRPARQTPSNSNDDDAHS